MDGTPVEPAQRYADCSRACCACRHFRPWLPAPAPRDEAPVRLCGVPSGPDDFDGCANPWPCVVHDAAPRDEGDEAAVDLAVDTAWTAGSDGRYSKDVPEAAAARSVLLARLAELRRERDEALGAVVAGGEVEARAVARAETAEAKLAEAQRQRDNERRAKEQYFRESCRADEALASAERRGDEAREALTLVLNSYDESGQKFIGSAELRVARAVIAPTTTSKEDHHG